MPTPAVVLIDGGYIRKIIKNLGSLRIDYGKFSEELCRRANCERFRTYYYDCLPHKSEEGSRGGSGWIPEAIRFMVSLRRLDRFIVRLGGLQKIEEDGVTRFRQKGVDIQVAMDILKVSQSGRVGKIILVSGDGDFAPALSEARDNLALVAIFYSKETYLHDRLFEACDERFEITRELLESCRMPA